MSKCDQKLRKNPERKVVDVEIFYEMSRLLTAYAKA